MATNRQKNLTALAHIQSQDPLSVFADSLAPSEPWDSIIDFATHPSFCGYKLYPRQKTLLKLIWLETEHMTQYDIDVIDEWRHGFGKMPSIGVPYDVWDRIEECKRQGRRHFGTVVGVLGRRASKGFTGAITNAAKVSQLVALDNPQQHFGLAEGKVLYGQIIATSREQAVKNLWSDTQVAISKCEWLKPYVLEPSAASIFIRTPQDLRDIQDFYNRHKRPPEHQIASIGVTALSSNASAGRGQSSFFINYDEFAFVLSGSGSEMSSEEIYASFQPALRNIGTFGFTYLPSSPWLRQGQFYTLYEQGSVLKGDYNEETDTFELHNEPQGKPNIVTASSVWDPSTLIIQLPSWNLYLDYEKSPSLGGPRFSRALMVEPDENSTDPVAREMAVLKAQDPVKFRVEYEAQFGTIQNAYLDPQKVENIFDNNLSFNTQGILAHEYHAHVDPSSVNKNFALSIGHIEMQPPDEDGNQWPKAVIDLIKVWKPQDFPDNTIDYVQVTEELGDIIEGFLPTLKTFSTDQFNGVMLRNTLQRRFQGKGIRFFEETFTQISNGERMEAFKSIVNLGWITSPKDSYFINGSSLAETELKALQERKTPSGNVIVGHPTFGPCRTDDVADAISVVAVRLLKNALDTWKSALATTPLYANTAPAPKLHGMSAHMQQQGNGMPTVSRSTLNNYSRAIRDYTVGSSMGVARGRRR